MKLYSLDFSTVALRLYLMMAIIIGAFFIGYPILAAFSLPLFFITMVGLKFSLPKIFGKKSSRPVAEESKISSPKRIKELHQTAH